MTSFFFFSSGLRMRQFKAVIGLVKKFIERGGGVGVIYAEELFGHPIITLTVLFPEEKVSACYDLFWNLQSPEGAGIFVTGFLLD